ncbi:hypothetical protein SAMN04489729_6987 [Amycolatopsis lurida]|uniref:Uncharacterized protein n=1 Tax=Amycolatopsis lurida NRRL 2430 TaxID=1460371 RepID=A0A2P2FFE6_AMYLU|nr:hypothetical protein [Amycolatopsis lurida]KFU75419.1 hypothetical protein BB31_41675 [Amycolatopsis lurida NRRL 2430]SEE29592.1 hypothetical protein SAMN04489729_6987 [Amycolatopsis lurida]
MRKVLGLAAVLAMAFAGQVAVSGTASAGVTADDCWRHPQGKLCGGLQNKTSRPQIAYIEDNGFHNTTVPAGRGTNPNIDYDGFVVTGNCTARATSVRYINGLGPSYNYTLVNSGKRYKFRTDEIVMLQGLVCR